MKIWLNIIASLLLTSKYVVRSIDNYRDNQPIFDYTEELPSRQRKKITTLKDSLESAKQVIFAYSYKVNNLEKDNYIFKNKKIKSDTIIIYKIKYIHDTILKQELLKTNIIAKNPAIYHPELDSAKIGIESTNKNVIIGDSMTIPIHKIDTKHIRVE